MQQTLSAGLSERYRVHLAERRFGVGQLEHREQYIEIRQKADDRLVTLLDVASLANKLTDPGREAHLATRQAAKATGANLVEIDLLLQGKPMLDYSREGLPPWDFSVTITRGIQPERYEIYTSTLQKRLPRYRVPMATDDRDMVLDLSTDFTQAYDQGGFEKQIDYGGDPGVPLSEEAREWIRQLLKDRRA
jgi:hypothetical protein